MSALEQPEAGHPRPDAVAPAVAYPTWFSAITALGSSLVSYLMIGAAAVGDAVNFQSALGVVMEDQPLYVVRLAVAALTSAAVGLMHFAGMSRKSFRCGIGRRMPAISLTGIWLLLGIGLLILRVVGYEPTSSAGAGFGTTAVAAPAISRADLAHYALALLFFFLYLATGAMASWAAYREHEPVQGAARRSARARRRAERGAERERRRAEQHAAELRRLAEDRIAQAHRRAEEELHSRQAELLELEAQAEYERNELLRDEGRRAAANEAIDAWGEELREYARQRMCAVVGTPWGTSALTSSDENH